MINKPQNDPKSHICLNMMLKIIAALEVITLLCQAKVLSNDDGDSIYKDKTHTQVVLGKIIIS